MFTPFKNDFLQFQKDEDYLLNKIFVGFVEENKDPKKTGRVRVRVQGVFDEIPVEHIPWSSRYEGIDGKSFNLPAIGKIVNVIFPQGDLYNPQYIYSENYNINLQNKLNGLSDDEYINFVALLFDHRSQVYADDTALNLDYFENVIRLQKTGIDVKLKDKTQKLNLGHSQCNQDAVLGTNFFKWMDGFMQTLLSPATLTGNLGAPVLRPALDQKIMEYQQLRETFVSKNVKIVDNNVISADDYNNNRKKTPTLDDKTKINDKKLLEQKTPETKKLVEKVKEDRSKNIKETVESKPVIINTVTPTPVQTPIYSDIPTTGTNSTLNITAYDDDKQYEHDNVLEEDDSVEEQLRQQENSSEEEIVETTESLSDDPYADLWGDYQDASYNKSIPTYTESPTYGAFTSTDWSSMGSINGGGSSYVDSGCDKKVAAMNFFMGKGWIKEHAAGIVGNLMVESGNFSDSVINGTKKGDKGKAVGIAQWHPDRQAKFKSLYNITLEGAPFEKQLEFVHWELTNTDKTAGNLIKTTRSAEAAAAMCDEKYERSSGEARKQRVTNANEIFSMSLECPKDIVTASKPLPTVGIPKNIGDANYHERVIRLATDLSIKHDRLIAKIKLKYADKDKFKNKSDWDKVYTCLTTGGGIGACPVGTGLIMATMLNLPNGFHLQCGHADQFSFKSVKSQNMPDLKQINKFYNPKQKVSNDYVKNKSQWQIGDILVLGYKTELSGHIQIWTGHSWISDFKQAQPWLGSGAQKDESTFALHRLNESGVKQLANNLANINKTTV